MLKMSLMLARIGGDLEALGRGGCDIDIDRVEREITSLYAITSSRKEKDVASQVSRLSPSLRDELGQGAAKLHLGCGRNVMPGWINVDLYGWRLRDALQKTTAENTNSDSVISLNLATTPLPLDDGTCQCIYTSHMLEHLSHPVETSIFMEEVFRVLAPGGVLRVVVPDAQKWLKSYTSRDENFLVSARQHWNHWDWRTFEEQQSWLDLLLPYLGASSLKGALTGSHQFGFDESSLRALLERSGFPRDSIERSSFQRSRHSLLRVDDRSHAAGATFDGEESDDTYFSLFMEARKPEVSAASPAAFQQRDNALQKFVKTLLGTR